jgi:choline kinase
LIGIVLAAGAGSRLGPLTRDRPKTLLPIDDDRTILDLALENLASWGVEEVVVVTGFAATAIDAHLPHAAERLDLELSTVFNERAMEWNNAYSLWLAREHFARGALVVNGDTVAPADPLRGLVDAAAAAEAPAVLIAVDRVKPLGDEEMKVGLDGDGQVRVLSKGLEPAAAAGEFIGVSAVRAAAAEDLADALQATWSSDPSLYYEDGFQLLAERGTPVVPVAIGTVDWVEVDTEADLERAWAIRCHS